jgi:hypothetical protein
MHIQFSLENHRRIGHLGHVYVKEEVLFNMDIGLNEMWTELNWLIVGLRSVNVVMHH